jgi:hypothetical protein
MAVGVRAHDSHVVYRAKGNRVPRLDARQSPSTVTFSHLLAMPFVQFETAIDGVGSNSG